MRLKLASASWLLLAVPLVVAHAMLWAGHTIDDAGVTFAYIETWLDGGGLAFRPGEPPVEAYTHALWLLILTPFAALGLDLEVVSKVLGLAFGAVAAVLVFRLLLRFGPRRPFVAVLGPLVLWGAPLFGFWVLSGLENGLFAMLLVLMLSRSMGDAAAAAAPGERGGGAAELRRHLPSALLQCALVMTRPDGILYVVAVQLWLLVQIWRRPAPWMTAPTAEPVSGAGPGTMARVRLRAWLVRAGLAAGLYLIYFAIRYAYFGQVLPNSFIAKSPGQYGGIQLFDLHAPGWSYVRAGFVAYALPAPLLVAAIAGLVWRPTRRFMALVLGSLAAGILFPVVTGGDWMFEWRFLALSWVFVALALGLGALALAGLSEAFVRRVRARGPTPGRLARPLGHAVGVALVALAALLFYEPWVARANERRALVDITVADLANRADFYDEVSEIAGVIVPRVADVDAGGITWRRTIGFLDLGKLGDLSIPRHYPSTYGHLRDYIFHEDRPHILHLHGGWFDYRIHDMAEWRELYDAILPDHTTRFPHVFGANLFAIAPFVSQGPRMQLPWVELASLAVEGGAGAVAGGGTLSLSDLEVALVDGDVHHHPEPTGALMSWALQARTRPPTPLPSEVRIVPCEAFDVDARRILPTPAPTPAPTPTPTPTPAPAPTPAPGPTPTPTPTPGPTPTPTPAPTPAPTPTPTPAPTPAPTPTAAAAPAAAAPAAPAPPPSPAGEGGPASQVLRPLAPAEVAPAPRPAHPARRLAQPIPSRPAPSPARSGIEEGPEIGARLPITWAGGVLAPRDLAHRRWIHGVVSGVVPTDLRDARCLAITVHHRGRDEVLGVSRREAPVAPLERRVAARYLAQLAAEPAILLEEDVSPLSPPQVRLLCASSGHLRPGACRRWFWEAPVAREVRERVEEVGVVTARSLLASASSATARAEAVDLTVGAALWLIAAREAVGQVRATDMGTGWRALSQQTARRLRALSDEVGPLEHAGLGLLELAIRTDPTCNRLRLTMERRRPRGASRVRAIEWRLREDLRSRLARSSPERLATRDDARALLASAGREGRLLEAWRCLRQGVCLPHRDAPEVAAWGAWLDGVLGLGPWAPRPETLREVWGFEGGALHGFVLHGEAFGPGPAERPVGAQQQPSGYEQRALLNSFHGGDVARGVAEGAPKLIEADFLGMLIGGGGPELGVRVELWVDDEIALIGGSPVRSPTLDPLVWDLRPFRGRIGRLRVVDDGEGVWAHILLDALTWLR